MLVVSYLRNICLNQGHKGFLLRFLLEVLEYKVRLCIYIHSPAWVHFYIWYTRDGSFCCLVLHVYIQLFSITYGQDDVFSIQSPLSLCWKSLVHIYINKPLKMFRAWQQGNHWWKQQELWVLRWPGLIAIWWWCWDSSSGVLKGDLELALGVRQSGLAERACHPWVSGGDSLWSQFGRV